MNKVTTILFIFLFALLCEVDSAQAETKLLLTSKNICELHLGSKEEELTADFKKITVYTEAGESYKFNGRVCNSSIEVEAEPINLIISKISIIDTEFCFGKLCIGMKFSEIKKLIPNANLFFSGEGGGIFSLEDESGLSFVFSLDEITIDCFVNPQTCSSKIESAKLIAIVI